MKTAEGNLATTAAGADRRPALAEAEALDGRGQWGEAWDAYARVLEDARRHHERRDEALALRRMGEIHRRRGEPEAALRLFRQSLHILRDLDDRKNLAYLYNNIALVFLGRGRWASVRRYFGRALRLARAEGDLKLVGQIFNNLGIMSQILGRDDKAFHYFSRALPAHREIGHGRGIAQTYNNIGMLYRDRGRWDDSRYYYERSLQISREIEDVNLIGISSLNLALALIYLERIEQAKSCCDEAHAIFERNEDRLGLAEANIYYGIIYRRCRNYRRSEACFRRSIEINERIQNALGLAEGYRELAFLFQDQGKSQEVLHYLGRSFKTFTELQATRYVEDVDGKIRKLEQIYFQITREMGEEVESKDTYTYGHCKRVAYYAVSLAGRIGLPETERKAILVAAFLHDLGKVKIPKAILCKPKKLTPDEYLTIMKHPGWGVDMLESIEFPWEIKPLILYHQERYDGKGYPEGLEGEKIPLGAQIISIADYFDALTTDRPYRRAMRVDEAFSVMERERGRVVNPQLMDDFEALIREWFVEGDTVIELSDFGDFLDVWKAGGNGESPGDAADEPSGPPGG